MNGMDGMNGKYQRYHCAVASGMIMMITGFDDLPKEAVKHLLEAGAILDKAVGDGFSLRVVSNGDEIEELIENL